MKVVINSCFGGFSLSSKGVKRYAELSGFEVFGYKNDYKDFNNIIRWNGIDEDLCIYWLKQDLGDNPSSERLNESEWLHANDIARDDEKLIQVISELGEKADGRCAKLKVVEIPDDVEWVISEYDGLESVEERHRSWY